MVQIRERLNNQRVIANAKQVKIQPIAKIKRILFYNQSRQNKEERGIINIKKNTLLVVVINANNLVRMTTDRKIIHLIDVNFMKKQ